ncbi:MAG TPA: ferredoxin--nitrite reductase [Chloroflexota bacterium]
MNKFEEIKAAKDGLDVWPDLVRYAAAGWEAISEDDKVRLKWYGVFFRKHTPGFFMLRIRIPNGVASTPQLRTIAELADGFCRGEINITTRQQVQLRWFRIEDAPDMISRLREVGLDTRQTGMDNIRNVMGCPLAGLSSQELFDASPIVREFTARLVGNRELTNLPRKFNVAISACPDNCLHLESQDVALTPAEKWGEDGSFAKGFNVLVGGKMGSGGFSQAQRLDAFVTPQQAVEVCCQIALLFRDHGPRETRSRARLAFLLEDWGLERFRAELEERLGYCLPVAGWDLRRPRDTDHLGVTPQQQPDRYSVGLALPVGRLSSAQARAAAELADEYGSGELRLTSGQNLILTHVPDQRLPELLAEPLLRELRPDPPLALRGTVACTGVGLCDLAMTDTKNDALAAAHQLDRTLKLRRPITISWSGCPAGCGNHHLADIGLQGARARVDGQVTQVYQVFVGGRSGRAARAGTEALADIPATEVGEVIQRLAQAHDSGQDLATAACEIAAERQLNGQAAA